MLQILECDAGLQKVWQPIEVAFVFLEGFDEILFLLMAQLPVGLKDFNT